MHDNGRGFSLENSTERRIEGNGLANMWRRMADIGGVCEIKSATGKRTTVSLSLKLSDAQLKYA
jgi:signal transduction histidine kinase